MGQHPAAFEQGACLRQESAITSENAWQAYEELNKNFFKGTIGAHCGGDLKKWGFPTPDLTGFDQEAIDHSEGLEAVWNGVRKFFGNKETNEDKLNDHVMKNLSPKEKDAYKAEEKQLDEYNRKWISWATQATINPGPPPEMPKLPMHDEVNRRVKAMEKQITEQIRSEISPHDCERLDRQMKEYADAYRESQRIHNPMGTGEGFRRPPKPPAVVQDYYNRVREAVDRVTRA